MVVGDLLDQLLVGVRQVNFSRPEEPAYCAVSCGYRLCPRRKGTLAQFPIMTRGSQVSTEVEEIVYSRMHIEKSLRLPARFETTHTAFAHSGRLM